MPQLLDYLLELTLFLDSPIGQTVNLLILALFALGVLDVLRTTICLVREKRTLKRASAALRNPGMTCPEKPAVAVLEFLAVSSHTLVGRVMARIIQLRTLGLSHREVIQFLATELFQVRPTFSRYVASTLTLIGLVGTVLGLSIAVVRTQGAVLGGYDLGALKELAAALAVTLAGMKTAFATTLTGLLTALILSGANYATSRFESRVARQLQDFVLFQFLPHLTDLPPVSHEYEDFATALRVSLDIRERLDSAMTQALASHEATLAQSTLAFRRSMEAMTTAIEQQLHELST